MAENKKGRCVIEQPAYEILTMEKNGDPNGLLVIRQGGKCVSFDGHNARALFRFSEDVKAAVKWLSHAENVAEWEKAKGNDEN